MGENLSGGRGGSDRPVGEDHRTRWESGRSIHKALRTTKPYLQVGTSPAPPTKSCIILRARKLLPGRSLLRSAIQKRRIHTVPVRGFTTWTPAETSLGDVPRRRLVGGGARTSIHSGVASPRDGLGGRLPGGSRWTCPQGRGGGCCCIVWGDACCLAERGTKASGSKYLPRISSQPH